MHNLRTSTKHLIRCVTFSEHTFLQMEQGSELEKVRNILRRRDYQITGHIGSGGYATVYRVYSEKYKRDFAAKVFHVTSQGARLSSYSSEIAVLKSLLYPSILMIYDHFTEGSIMCIILEYCPGGNIGQLIKDGTGISSVILYPVVECLVRTFAFMHSQSIAHRDIKPGNILLDAYNRIKIADFGLSQKMDNKDSNIWRFGGTRPFLSPEIIKRESYNPFQADIWSLGVTIYLIATGKLPWVKAGGESLDKLICAGKYEIPDSMDPELADVINSMLRVVPEERKPLSEVIQMPYFTIEKHLQKIPNEKKVGIHAKKLSTSVSCFGTSGTSDASPEPRAKATRVAGFLVVRRKKEIKRLFNSTHTLTTLQMQNNAGFSPYD